MSGVALVTSATVWFWEQDSKIYTLEERATIFKRYVEEANDANEENIQC